MPVHVARDHAGSSLGSEPAAADLGLVIVFFVLALTAVALRLASARLVSSVSVGFDGWLLLAAIVVASAQAGCSIARDFAGHFGDPESSLNHAELELYSKLSLSLDVLYPTVATLARWSLCWLFLKTFRGTVCTLSGYMLLTVNALWWIFAVAFKLGRCQPLSMLWTMPLDANCVRTVTVFLSISSLDLICNMATFVLPLFKVGELAVSRIQKLGLIVVFALSISVIGIAAGRIPASLRVREADLVGTNTIYAELAYVESSLLIIIASLPKSHALLERLLPSTAEARIGDLRDRAFQRLQIQKIDFKTGLPVDPRPGGRDSTVLALADLHLGDGPASPSSTTARNESAKLARGAGGVVRADAQVHADPVAMPRSGFDPIPRGADLSRDLAMAEDEIRITQEVEVSFV